MNEIPIYTLKERKILLETGVGILYGVSAKRAAEQYRRNADRFPLRSVFYPNKEEWQILLPQIASTSDKILFVKSERGGRRHPPLIFDVVGMLVLGTVLRSQEAKKACLCVSEAFRTVLGTMLEYPFLEGHLSSSLAKLEDQGGESVKMAIRMIRKIQQPTSPS